MGAWDRSWSITQTSFRVIRADKEMLWFPVLGAIFSVLFSAALLVPTFALDMADKAGAHRAAVGPLQYAVLFATYFGLAFIATFFNVCTVYTTRVRLSGGDATFGESIKFAFSRIHLIAAWALVSATVGLLLHALDRIAERSGLIGKILLSILRAILASAWSITTIFVVPAMVYRELGPFDAIRDSLDTLRRTWGESLIRYYGMGLVSFVCAIPCFLLIVLGVAAASSIPALGMALVGLGVLALVGVILVFNVANTVFNTALYHWATTGEASSFDPQLLRGALVTR